VKRYARWLFGLAALANLAVAAAMSLGQGWFQTRLGLDPIAGTNGVLVDLAAELIAVFGMGYGWIAIDPSQRALIWLGATGKAAAVALVLAGALANPHLWRFFGLVSGDLLFAALFLDFLRRTRSHPWT
jgi:hypothetical protein